VAEEELQTELEEIILEEEDLISYLEDQLEALVEVGLIDDLEKDQGLTQKTEIIKDQDPAQTEDLDAVQVVLVALHEVNLLQKDQKWQTKKDQNLKNEVLLDRLFFRCF